MQGSGDTITMPDVKTRALGALRAIRADQKIIYRAKIRDDNPAIVRASISIFGDDTVAEKVDEYSGLVCETDSGRLIAYVLYTIDDATNADIWEVAVNENFRGIGIGTEIMRRALDTIGDQRRIELRVADNPGKDSLIEFYEAFGFKATGTTDLNSTVMERPAKDSVAKKTLVIVGGGTGGLIIARRAFDTRLYDRIIIIEPGPSRPHPLSFKLDDYLKQFGLLDETGRKPLPERPWVELGDKPRPGQERKAALIRRAEIMGGADTTNGGVHLKGTTPKGGPIGFAGRGWTNADLRRGEALYREAIAASGPPINGRKRDLTRFPPNPLTRMLQRAAEASGIPSLDSRGGFASGLTANGGTAHVLNLQDANGVRLRTYEVMRIRGSLGKDFIHLRGRARALLFDDNERVRGVVWDDPEGRRRVRRATDVWLCAGSLEDPRILIRSGLRRLPFLGALREEFRLDVIVKMDPGGEMPDTVVPGFTMQTAPTPENYGGVYIEVVWGEKAGPAAPGWIWVPGRPLLTAIGDRLVSLEARQRIIARRLKNVVVFAIIVRVPHGRGRVGTTAPDDFSYDLHAKDVAALRIGLGKLLEILARTGAVQPFKFPGLAERLIGPVRLITDEEIRRQAKPSWHDGGTCEMGVVVDGRTLEVNGVRGVRVGSMSMIPGTGSNPTAALRSVLMQVPVGPT